MTENHTAKWNEKSFKKLKKGKTIKIDDKWQKITQQNEMKKVEKKIKKGKNHKIDNKW